MMAKIKIKKNPILVMMTWLKKKLYICLPEDVDILSFLSPSTTKIP